MSYPDSPTYSKRQVDEANDLYDEHSIPVVSEKTGVPEGTLYYWKREGHITTEKNHHRWAQLDYDEDTVERAGRLWDVMPLRKVSEIIHVPLATLYRWSRTGLISTDAAHHHKSNAHPDRMKRRARRAAQLVHDLDHSHAEAAEKMDVSPSMVTRYLKMYETGTYVTTQV